MIFPLDCAFHYTLWNKTSLWENKIGVAENQNTDEVSK